MRRGFLLSSFTDLNCAHMSQFASCLEVRSLWPGVKVDTHRARSSAGASSPGRRTFNRRPRSVKRSATDPEVELQTAIPTETQRKYELSRQACLSDALVGQGLIKP